MLDILLGFGCLLVIILALIGLIAIFSLNAIIKYIVLAIWEKLKKNGVRLPKKLKAEFASIKDTRTWLDSAINNKLYNKGVKDGNKNC